LIAVGIDLWPQAAKIADASDGQRTKDTKIQRYILTTHAGVIEKIRKKWNMAPQ